MNLYQFQSLFLSLYTSGYTSKHHSVNFMLVTKAPFTRQKIFGAAWMKVVRVPKQ